MVREGLSSKEAAFELRKKVAGKVGEGMIVCTVGSLRDLSLP